MQATSADHPMPRSRPRLELGVWYVVLLLMGANALSFIDRLLIGLLIEPIKADLSLSDLQMGLLAGPAFAVVFVSAGLVMGWIADRWNRRNLILAGMAIWVLATIAGGLVGSFAGLLVARALLALGESVLNPAAVSLIADQVPGSHRARALGIYSTGVYFGSALAMLLGGAVLGRIVEAGPLTFPVVGTMQPWQLTFVVVAAPGLLLLLLVARIHEPVRAPAVTAVPDVAPQRWGLHVLLLAGFSVMAIVTYGLSTWVPSMFVRTWGWRPEQIGLAYGLILLGCGPLAMLGGGMISDRLQAGGHTSAPLDIALACTTLLIVAAWMLMRAVTVSDALVALVLITVLLGATVALLPTVMLAVTPASYRGRVVAGSTLAINLVGLGIGPPLIAFLGGLDVEHADPLRWSLAAAALAAASASVLLLAIARNAFLRVARWELGEPTGHHSA